MVISSVLDFRVCAFTTQAAESLVKFIVPEMYPFTARIAIRKLFQKLPINLDSRILLQSILRVVSPSPSKDSGYLFCVY